MTPQRQKRLREQIRRSRARLMVSDPALAMLLMYLRFVATKDVYRISTNRREILFDPDWFQMLGKKETDYILSHEVIHIVLEDTKRPAFFTGDRFHHACDIIACSVMRNRGWQDASQIRLLIDYTRTTQHKQVTWLTSVFRPVFPNLEKAHPHKESTGQEHREKLLQQDTRLIRL